MDKLITFKFSDAEIRVLHIDDSPWFVAGDIATILGYRDATAGLRMVPNLHKGTHSVCTNRGPRDMTIIDEPGLYRLILRSQRPEAEPFMEWVTTEVLPAIRKTGRYQVDLVDVDHRATADVMVNASRTLGALLKAGTGYGLAPTERIRRANAATARCHGVDFIQELGVQEILRIDQQSIALDNPEQAIASYVNDKDSVTIREVLTEALNIPAGQITRRDQTSVGIVLARLPGWRKARVSEGGTRQNRYIRRRELSAPIA